MDLKLYNTLSRKKEVFRPIKKKQVSLYTCGPTVYNFAHIGNLRTYIFEDILKRTLLYNKYSVKHVMNITDVGHLTSDADSGEDKMLKGAKREKKTVWQIAEFYTKAFKNDLKKLNILPPNTWCKATDHIKEQLEMIEILEKNNFTYEKGGNVYFDTSKLTDYGKLTKLNKKTIARVEKDPNKKSQNDFVLWFTKSKFSDQEMKWTSKYGKGYPGWHIECSAMASKYLGKNFDIHCGGIDHIQVHHTNEIAQSEATFKKQWVNYWLHSEFLVIEDKKMAKSGENFITLDKIKDPIAYRYLALNSHYRKPLSFSWKNVESANNALTNLIEKIKTFLDKDKNKEENINKFIERFQFAINDDLNTPEALAVVWDLVKNKKLSNKSKLKAIKNFDKVLGLNLTDIKKDKINKKIKNLIEEREKARKEKISKKVKDLIEEREKAREEKDYRKSDMLRKKLDELGIVIEDTKDGVKWRKKS